jgi:hypothetical protein
MGTDMQVRRPAGQSFVQSTLFNPMRFGHRLQLQINAFSDQQVQNKYRAIERDTDCCFGLSDFWINEVRIEECRLYSCSKESVREPERITPHGCTCEQLVIRLGWIA